MGVGVSDPEGSVFGLPVFLLVRKLFIINAIGFCVLVWH